MSVRAAGWWSVRVSVEDFDEPRTMLGEKRVLARRGWAGEETGFFSILLGHSVRLR
ncbi:MAG: hypothetical protein HOP22_09200 [Nitrospiraceae bacterium]|nr:hypothetical protein [Nitrospiraceae bacterium]